MIRVVVADAHPFVRAGLRTVLESAGDIDVVAEAADGVAALEAAERLHPDVLLMELRARRLDAVELARLVQGTRLVVLAATERDDYVVAALRAGASAFVVKNAPATEIVRAVRVVARGDGVFEVSLLQRLLLRAVDALPPRRPRTPAWFRELNDGDRDLLILIAEGRSNADIGESLGTPEAIVAERIADLLVRLGLRDRTQAVVRVYETGVLRPVPH
jgi:DNA-binding NarL/FixJ family response regulator